MSLFDLSKPGVGVTQSSFGGGWVWSINAAGKQALREFFGEEPGPIPVTTCNDAGESTFIGYIVEPWQTQGLAEHLQSCNVAWEIR